MLLLASVCTSLSLTVEANGQAAAPKLFRVTTNVPEARMEFEAGLFELREGLLSRARKRVAHALALDSTIAVARALNARVGLWPSSEMRRAEFARAVEEASHASAEELLFAMAWREWTIGRRDVGNAAWAALAELTADDPAILEELPAILLAKRRHSEALAQARQLVARFPEYPRMHTVLAYTILSAEADTAAALAALSQYPARAPESAHAHMRLARSAASWGHWEYAEANYRRAVDIDSTFVYGHFGLADVALGKGAVAEAQKHLDLAISHEPESAERSRLARFRAHLSLLSGTPDHTLSVLQGLADEEQRAGRPNIYASILMEAAAVDALVGSGRNVDELLRRARQTPNANQLSYYAWAGTAYAFAKRITDARVAADSLEVSARRLQNNYMAGPIVRMVRGMADYAAGEYERALMHLAASDSQYVLVEMTRALALSSLGRRVEAEEARDRVRGWTKYQPYSAADALARAVVNSKP